MEELLELAQKVQPLVKRFYLAGGTAIMFKHRHRQSVDLDFFTPYPFSKQRLIHKIRRNFFIEGYEIFEDNLDIIIEKTRVSFVFFPFSNIKKVENFKGIRIASDYDIFLNKIYAAGRRIDWKDPYDTAFLYRLHRWDLNEVKRDFEKKFPNQSFELFLGALLNFEDYPDLPEWVKEVLEEMARSILSD